MPSDPVNPLRPSDVAELVAAARRINSCRFFTHPISTIAWGVVLAFFLWLIVIPVVIFLLVLTGAVSLAALGAAASGPAATPSRQVAPPAPQAAPAPTAVVGTINADCIPADGQPRKTRITLRGGEADPFVRVSVECCDCPEMDLQAAPVWRPDIDAPASIQSARPSDDEPAEPCSIAELRVTTTDIRTIATGRSPVLLLGDASIRFDRSDTDAMRRFLASLDGR